MALNSFRSVAPMFYRLLFASFCDKNGNLAHNHSLLQLRHKAVLNSSTIDELGSWCLKRLVEPGSNEARGRRYPWQPCERPPPKAPSH